MKPVTEQTLYEILEVPVDAPESDIVRAWERAEALYGPDSLSTYTLISPDDAALMSARLEEALNVLLDPAERSRYDARIRGRPEPHGLQADLRPVTCDRAELDPAPLPPVIPPVAALTSALAADQLLVTAAAAPRPGALAVALKVVPRPEDSAPLPECDETADAYEDQEGDQPLGDQSLGVLALAAGAGQDEQAAVAEVSKAPAEDHSQPPILLCRVVEEPRRLTPVSLPFAAMLQTSRPAESPAQPIGAPTDARSQATTPAPDLDLAEPCTGDMLRRARQVRGLSVQQVCERTKIMRHHLENIEADCHEKLPAPVYVRGILMALSKELRLDGQKVARSYLDAVASKPPARGR